MFPLLWGFETFELALGFNADHALLHIRSDGGGFIVVFPLGGGGFGRDTRHKRLTANEKGRVDNQASQTIGVEPAPQPER